jgi:hypothetical protein
MLPFFCSRTALAMMPRAFKSFERYKLSASASEMRCPLSTFSAIGRRSVGMSDRFIEAGKFRTMMHMLPFRCNRKRRMKVESSTSQVSATFTQPQRL